ncbi:phosphoglycerate kinase [Chloroflexota bacterium]
MKKMTVRDVDVRGKRVLVRVDFNVPLDEKTGTIGDDSRIQAALPTIEYLVKQGAKVILCSHLGRPEGKVVDNLRMTGIAERLSQHLKRPVQVASECIGPKVERAVAELKDGDILLLENLRFHPEEEKNDPAFAQALANLADIYVNDAFGTAHRSHASITGVAEDLPAVAGFLMERELATLGSILENPARPFIAVLGGAKISDKVGMLENIMNKVDALLIGGGMANVFLKAMSFDTGQSLAESGSLSTVFDLMKEATAYEVRILLPIDVVVTDETSAGAGATIVSMDEVPPQMKIVDIGPQTIENFRQELEKSRTVFWNGPMGIDEIPEFAQGTRSIAQILAGIKAATIIGGGSTAEVVIDMKLADEMTFVSTGGGASLRFLGGRSLPGVEALLNKDSK